MRRRHRGGKPCRQRIAALLQVAAYGTADNRHEDVVGGSPADPFADPQHLRHIETDALDDAARRNRPGKTRPDRLLRPGQLLQQAIAQGPAGRPVVKHLAGKRRHLQGRGRNGMPQADDPRHGIARRARIQFGRRRHGIGKDRPPRYVTVLRHRDQRMQCPQDLRARLAIDLGAVKLDVDRETAGLDAGNVVDPLDDISLPKRLVAIEDQRMQARDLDAEMPPVTRLGQRNMADMVLEVHFSLVDPVGAIEIEGHADKTPAQHRRDIQPLANMRHDIAQPDLATRRRTRIINPQHRHVHALVGLFHGEEEFVQTAKLFHVQLRNWMNFPLIICRLSPTSTEPGSAVPASRPESPTKPRMRP